MTNDLLYYLAFSHFLGIGPIRFKAMLSYCGNTKSAYEAKEKELEKILGLKLAKNFLKFRSRFDPVAKLEELKSKDIKVLPINSINYPESLKNISDPPICIYLKGLIPNFLSNLFAVVGTRLPTVYGQQIAYKFSKELANAGFVIVSGLARGVDSIAHKAAINNCSKTIAVLGCGVDIVYPAENYQLYQKIIETGGAIISEFPPGQMVFKGLFIARNRIISGLSKGVLIIEGSDHSGALITAKYAGVQGKEVFAVPSPITSIMSQAPNLLIKQGAKLITSAQDIFDEFDMKITPKKQEEVEKNLNNEEKLIFNFIKQIPKSADETAIFLKKPVSLILNTISMLELKGIIEKNSENKYQVRL